MTVSDPEMWDEQPHDDCVNNGGQVPNMYCVRNKLRYPSQPQEPATSGGPRTITITTRQAATLVAQGSGITRQPPDLFQR